MSVLKSDILSLIKEEKMLINSSTSFPASAQSSIKMLYNFPISVKLGIVYSHSVIVSKLPLLYSLFSQYFNNHSTFVLRLPGNIFNQRTHIEQIIPFFSSHKQSHSFQTSNNLTQITHGI